MADSGPRPLRIAVLEADVLFEPWHTRYGGYTGLYTTLLTASADRLAAENKSESGPGAETVELDIKGYDVVDRGEYPDTLHDLDVVLISGSKHDAFESIPWMNTLVAYTQKVLAHPRVVVIGICFGHQILARAQGVPVVRGPTWEISAMPFSLTTEGQDVFRTEKQELTIFQSHRDYVTALPPQARNLGSTDPCAIHGMYVPNRYISVQGHPEYTPEYVAAVLEIRHKAGVFDGETYDEAMGRVWDRLDGVEVACGLLRFALRAARAASG